MDERFATIPPAVRKNMVAEQPSLDFHSNGIS